MDDKQWLVYMGIKVTLTLFDCTDLKEGHKKRVKQLEADKKDLHTKVEYYHNLFKEQAEKLMTTVSLLGSYGNSRLHLTKQIITVNQIAFKSWLLI